MTGRQKAIAFFVTLGVCLVVAAVALNVSWIILQWRRVLPLVLGAIFFALIIAGLIVYTVFLVREIRRNDQHDSFINSVTHELKTPIASIRLYLETLQSREVGDRQRREFYEAMLADADRLHHTVEQVLKAGVVGHKNRRNAHTWVRMAPLVEECAEMARTRHHLTAEALRCLLAMSGDAAVLGDADELRTAIANLLDNAVKYSRAGSSDSDSNSKVDVTLELTSVPKKVLVRVHDRGMGIPGSQLKHIFDRFYRVETRAVKKVKGTGLGLYIVRSIARRHKGRVYAHSDGDGKGSVFTLELPGSNA